jgi:hypothetical protein
MLSILPKLLFYALNAPFNGAGPLVLIIGGWAVISRRVSDGNDALIHCEINQLIQSICFKGLTKARLFN